LFSFQKFLKKNRNSSLIFTKNEFPLKDLKSDRNFCQAALENLFLPFPEQFAIDNRDVFIGMQRVSAPTRPIEKFQTIVVFQKWYYDLYKNRRACDR
jgi:hypothetical protein